MAQFLCGFDFGRRPGQAHLQFRQSAKQFQSMDPRGTMLYRQMLAKLHFQTVAVQMSCHSPVAFNLAQAR